jgi:GTP-binding protein HflX
LPLKEYGLSSHAGVNALVIYPHTHDHMRRGIHAENRLEEACSLAKAIDLNVLEAHTITLKQMRPNTLIGEGNVDMFRSMIQMHDIALVIVDGTLSPVQQRNLEKAWKTKVIDRTGLILEIFGARAQTKEGSLQVELAALTYQRSRLVRSWTHLERQRGGLGFIGGPGETQLEMDRRMISDRILKIEKELERVKNRRQLHRQARQRVPYPIVALVGYTNAGKSTLFNTLTKASVFAEDLLFATLDPTMRLLRLPSGTHVILSDTVGFISDLPTLLVAAFRATLEEVQEADLILHIQDASNPDRAQQERDVVEVLCDLGVSAEHATVINVFNKLDRGIDEETQELLEREKALGISALTGQGLHELLKHVDEVLAHGQCLYHVTLPMTQGKALAWLHANGVILSQEVQDDLLHVAVKLKPHLWEKFLKNTSLVRKGDDT